MSNIPSEERTNEMSSQTSTLDNDLEASHGAVDINNNNASGEEIIEKGEEDGIAASTANGAKDFPDLAPSRSMEFPDGIVTLEVSLCTGGREAWLTVCGGFLCLFTSFGMSSKVMSNGRIYKRGWCVSDVLSR
jgi:hypothetical protein